MKSSIAMGNPADSSQLLSGFYGIEGNSWRWTARQFVIAFPGCREGQANKPHNLKLDVFVPDGQIQKLGPLTLTAVVNGTELPPETFRAAGVHTFMRAVPEVALQSNIVPVLFSLNRATPPESNAGRELGLVVNSARLFGNQDNE